MKRRGQGFILAAALVSLVILAAGLLLADRGAWPGVLVGAGVGYVFQAGIFWLLAVMLFPAQQLLVFGLGMVGRMLVAGVAAFVAVPVLGLPPVATLFSLVSVFFATALLEPVFLFPASSSKS